MVIKSFEKRIFLTNPTKEMYSYKKNIIEKYGFFITTIRSLTSCLLWHRHGIIALWLICLPLG